jgi:hypothetical protein
MQGEGERGNHNDIEFRLVFWFNIPTSTPCFLDPFGIPSETT